jgi:hypothetical protein
MIGAGCSGLIASLASRWDTFGAASA